jgi:hypothetical protein
VALHHEIFLVEALVIGPRETMRFIMECTDFGLGDESLKNSSPQMPHIKIACSLALFFHNNIFT